jgi:hypothetical protein
MSRQRWIVPACITLILGWMAFAMVTTAREQSPIFDEPVYVAAAVAYSERGSLQVNPEHPPLTKLLIAGGLKLTDVHLDPDFAIGKHLADEWVMGRAVLYEMGNDTGKVMLMARLPMIVLTLLFGLVVFAFARDLFGAAGGLIALAAYAFSPDIIAHGSLATNDVALAGFLLTTAWLLWRTRSRPWLYLPLAGLAFGCALASKMNALGALPVMGLLAGLSVWHARAGQRHRLLQAALAVCAFAAIATVVVWLTYLVIDPSLTLVVERKFVPPSGLTRLILDWLPFPDPYIKGLWIQLKFERGSYASYLFGSVAHGSRWYYLPVALAVKEPLGMLALWPLGAVALAAIKPLRPIALYVLLPVAVLFGLAMNASRDLGVRYVIWLPMFMAVAAAAVLAYRKRRVMLPIALSLIAFAAFSVVRAFPYYLPYSNEAFGGPAQTYKYLNDSNVDWGQDLSRLGQYLDRNAPGEPVWLAYSGTALPSYYGIDARDPSKLPPSEIHGLLAISYTKLTLNEDKYGPLIEGQTPIADIGYSILVFRLP